MQGALSNLLRHEHVDRRQPFDNCGMNDKKKKSIGTIREYHKRL